MKKAKLFQIFCSSLLIAASVSLLLNVVLQWNARPVSSEKLTWSELPAPAPENNDTSVGENGNETAALPINRDLRNIVLTTKNVGGVGDELLEQITACGGRKAGKVELGWKNGKGRYFHFFIPSNCLGQIFSALDEGEIVQDKSGPRDRPAPAGETRMIIQVQAGK